MANRFIIPLFLFLVIGCGQKAEPAYIFSEEDFERVLFDVELAREASRTAVFGLRDSLFQTYMEAIALRNEVTADEITDEIRNRLNQEEDFADVYDGMRARIDSILARNKQEK